MTVSPFDPSRQRREVVFGLFDGYRVHGEHVATGGNLVNPAQAGRVADISCAFAGRNSLPPGN
jgi:hypothetical protein